MPEQSQCPEALLLFRMGDFYELFHEDARTAARVLGLAAAQIVVKALTQSSGGRIYRG